MVKKNLNQSDLRKREWLGLLVITMAILVFMSLVSFNQNDFPNSGSKESISNWMGLAGAYLSYGLFTYTIGYASFVFPILIFLFGWNLFLNRSFKPVLRVGIYLISLGLYLSTALAIPEVTSPEGSEHGFRLSGLLGGFFADYLTRYLGTAGSMVVMIFLFILFLVSATSWSMREAVLSFQQQINSIWVQIRRWARSIESPQKKTRPKIRKPEVQSAPKPEQPIVIHHDEPGVKKPTPKQPPPMRPKPEPVQQTPAPKAAAPSPSKPAYRTVPDGPYQMPPLEILKETPAAHTQIDRSALEEKAHFLEEKLQEFDVRGEVTGITPGPVITRFEVTPAAGVKISRFTGVQDDLALVMRASRVRVVAPIPGKAAVGIEIPNENPSIVGLRDILQSKSFRDSKSKLTLALGKTIEGKPFSTDLAELPHLLVAGATGAGKSVCLNAIIASILYRSKPEEVKLVLIDPKKLELSLYKKLRQHHLTTSENLGEDVITTVDNAVAVLKSVEREMEKRYRVLARVGVRSLDDFNKLVKQKEVKPDPDGDALKPFPYIVVIVDELADLMITGAREVEEPIARLAQMARAVGIHLVLATQRPSVDVITGVIKANFPARIAFQVIAKTDSRTILDRNGAEKLLGRGDMLFLHPREPEPTRVHGAFVSTQEVQSLVKFISTQAKSDGWKLPGIAPKGGPDGIGGTGERDELFWEAAKLVVRHQQGSASLLQRRLRVGYARAGRLIDELEDAGIVGPFDGSKAREVLMDEMALDELQVIEGVGGEHEI